MIRARPRFLAAASLLLAFAACRENAPAADAPVVFLLSPSHATRLQQGDVEALSAALTQAAGMPVTVKGAASAGAAIEAFGGAGADLGLLTSFEFLLARQVHGVQPRLQVVRGGESSYYADLLVKADSPLKSIDDLKGRPVAFVDEYSVSGFILPALLLAHLDIKPQFTGSHDKSLQALKEGKVDAAATFAGAAKAHPELRVLAPTGNVPNEPVFIRKGMDAARATRVLDALASLAKDPAQAALLGRLGGITAFNPVTDAAYDELLEFVRSSGKRIEDLVPGGRNAVWSNLPATLGAP